jgi:pilus assembly protein Flp/PilA
MRRLLADAVRRFIATSRGATAIEYGLIAAGITLAIIAAVQLTGTKVNALWTSVSTAFH